MALGLCCIHCFLHSFKRKGGKVRATLFLFVKSFLSKVLVKEENSELWVIPRPFLYLWDPFADVCYVNAPL